MRRFIRLTFCLSLFVAACSSGSSSDSTASPTAAEQDDSTSPADTTSTPSTQPGPTTTSAPSSPYVELPAPEGFRRTTPNAEVIGVLAATADKPRIAVGTETAVDGSSRPAVWTWEPGAPASVTPLPGQERPASVHRGPSGATYVLANVVGDTTLLWTSDDRLSWEREEIDTYIPPAADLVEIGGELLFVAADQQQIFAVKVAGGKAAPPVAISAIEAGSYGQVSDIATNGTTVVAITSVGDFTSADGGLTWAPILVETDQNADWSTSTIHWIGDRFVTVGGLLANNTFDMQTWSSSDGLTWARDDMSSLGEQSTYSSAVVASDGTTLSVLRQTNSRTNFDNQVLSTRDPSGVWTDALVVGSDSDDTIEALRSLQPYATAADVSTVEALFVQQPTEWTSLSGTSVLRMVGGQMQPPDVLAADEGYIAAATAYGVGSEIGVALDGKAVVSGGVPSSPRLTATTSDRSVWTVATSDELPVSGRVSNPGLATDGTTTLRSALDGTVSIRRAGDADWQPTGQIGKPAHLPGLWLVENDGQLTTSADGVTWSAPVATGANVHCALPDGRLIGIQPWNAGNPSQLVTAALDTGVVEVLPRPEQLFDGCATTSAGVILNIGNQFALTVDGLTFSPLASEPEFGFASSLSLPSTYGFGKAVVGNSRGLSFTVDGSTWENIPFPNSYRKLLSVGPAENGWVVVVEDNAGARILFLPN
jgi:hypothetical protein